MTPTAPRRPIWLWVTTCEQTIHEESSDGRMLLDVDPASLSISAQLRGRLAAWAEQYLDQITSEAELSRVVSPEEIVASRVEGFRLAADLQHELGPGFDVYYRDQFAPRESWFTRLDRSS